MNLPDCPYRGRNFGVCYRITILFRNPRKKWPDLMPDVDHYKCNEVLTCPEGLR